QAGMLITCHGELCHSELVALRTMRALSLAFYKFVFFGGRKKANSCYFAGEGYSRGTTKN
ncbi:MAG TPA: hypothetical protein PKZ12_07820, partial [Smithellaceae bacterium]|nr:hypothetical protein [Smithellaceae bacterium]